MVFCRLLRYEINYEINTKVIIYNLHVYNGVLQAVENTFLLSFKLSSIPLTKYRYQKEFTL